jgi:hypothetical protein
MRHPFAVAAFVLGVLASCGEDHHDQHIVPVRTGRFELTIVANEPTRPVSFRATGSFDADRAVFSLTTDFGELGPGFGDAVEIVATPGAVFVDCPYLTRLLGAPTKWISVRGAAGDIVRSWIVDPLRVLDAAGSSAGLVRGTTMRFADGSEDGSVLVSLEYFDEGAPVDIDPPAADQVTDETDVFNRLFGGTTGG